MITRIAEKNNIDVRDAPFPGEKMQVLVEELSKKNKVVILIDEYDYPIINSISDLKRAQKNRDLLKHFFSVIKGLDKYIRAIFLTGVSKFSKASIFSGMNNLDDITVSPIAATLLGYTQEEITTVFNEHIKDVAETRNINPDLLLEDITEWYNGYRFSKEKVLVYNPFSVLQFLQKKEFSNYWLATGTPGFLYHLLKKQYGEMIDLRNIGLPSERLGSFEIENIPLIPILYQTGYLTIKDYDQEKDLYKLDVPNREVRESFNKSLFATFVHVEP